MGGDFFLMHVHKKGPFTLHSLCFISLCVYEQIFLLGKRLKAGDTIVNVISLMCIVNSSKNITELMSM